MPISEHNKIHIDVDTKDVIQAKIDVIKKAVETEEVSPEELEQEKARVSAAIDKKGLVGYAFNW